MIVASCFLGIAPLALPAQPTSFPEPALLPSVAAAALPEPGGPFRYSYVQAGLQLGDATGFSAEVVQPLDGQWIAVGRLDLAELGESGIDADLTRFMAGVGYVRHLETNLDLIVTGQLEYADVDPDGGSGDDDIGINVRTGARYLHDASLEFFGGLSLFTTFESDFTFDAGAVLHLDQGISIVGRLEHDDDDVVTIGVRYNF